MVRRLALLTLTLAVCFAGCATRIPSPTGPEAARALESREGLASWYGRAFHGRTMASGRPFDMRAMIAAHPTYPFGTILRVTNLVNGRQVSVRVLDRGPAAGPQATGVIVDLSRAAAERLGFLRDGRVRVRLEVLEWGR
jgi:rare lipoprotein A